MHQPRHRLNVFLLLAVLTALALHAAAPAVFAASVPDLVWTGAGQIGPSCLAITPGGSVVATGGQEDHTIKLWSIAGGTLLRTLAAHYGAVRGVAISPDGTLLASTGEPVFGLPDDGVRIWQLSDGTQVRTLPTNFGQGECIAFSPDGTLLAAGIGFDVKIWRVSDGSLVRTLSGHSWNVFDIAFSPDGTILASGSGDHTIKLWRVSDGALLRTLTGHAAFVQAVTISPDGVTLVSGSLDGQVKLWRVSDGAPIGTLPGHTNAVTSIKFSPNGHTIGVGSWDHTVSLYAFPGGAFFHTLTAPDVRFVNEIAFLPGGTTLVSCSFDGHSRLWNISDGSLVRTFGHHAGYVSSVSFSPDGVLFASASQDMTGRIWHAADGIELHTLISHIDIVNTIAISSGGIVATGAGAPPPDTVEPVIKFWRASDGMLLRTVAGHAGGTTSVAFQPDGLVLASGGRDDRLRFWRTSDGAQIRVIVANGGGVRAIAYSPDGSMLAAANQGASVKLWNPETSSLIRTIPLDWSPSCLAFSSDGTQLVVGVDGYGGNVKLFRVSDGALLRTFPGHANGFPHGVAFTPDGKYIASASGYTFEILVWRVADGALVASYDQETGWGPWPSLPLVFSPDGQTFGYGRADATVAMARNPFAPATTVEAPADAARGAMTPLWGEPNPFAVETSISFGLGADASDVEVRIVDVSGREVRRIAGGPLAAGSHAITWDGRDTTGHPAPPGLYFAGVIVEGHPEAGGKLLRMGAR